MSNKITKRVIATLIILATFFFGYEMGLAPQKTNAQGIIQYQRCYSIKTSIEGYKEFNEGIVNEDEALILPDGWTPLGFTGNNNNMFALICEKK